MVWLIWKGRNNKIFNNVEFSSEDVVEEVKVRLWSWAYVLSESLLFFLS